MIKIDMTFPNNYYVNDKCYMDDNRSNFNEWYLSLFDMNPEKSDMIYSEKIKDIKYRLGLENL